MNDPRLYKIRLIADGVKYTAVAFFSRHGELCIGAEHIEGTRLDESELRDFNSYFDQRDQIRELLRKQFYVHYPELIGRVWQ